VERRALQDLRLEVARRAEHQAQALAGVLLELRGHLFQANFRSEAAATVGTTCIVTCSISKCSCNSSVAVLQEGIVGVALRHHQVRGQRDLATCPSPRRAGRAPAPRRAALQQRLHRMQVHAFGHAVEQQVQRLLEQAPGAPPR
jgi:hypothetical protein